MGRPPIGKIAMTPAERKRRQRTLEVHSERIRAALNGLHAITEKQVSATLEIVADIAALSEQEFRDIEQDGELRNVTRYDRKRWIALAARPELVRKCVERIYQVGRMPQTDPIYLAMRALSRNHVTK